VGIVETAAGVILGAFVTVLASRYYFRRSISKRLGAYSLLNSFVFDGIAPDVRGQLQFRFQDREVNELQQVLFLVANDGERAIRDVIEPLTLSLPAGVEVLDASIVHRQPGGLKAQITAAPPQPGGTSLALEFPLLNKGEFFVVKLLMSGRFVPSELAVLCDDLPRTIKMEPLPANSLREPAYKFELALTSMGLGILIIPAWACYAAYLLHGYPALFHPLALRPGAMEVHVDSLVFLVFGGLIMLAFAVIGFGLSAAGAFGGEFPPPRGPRFRLPKELQTLVFPYPVLRLAANEPTPKNDSDQGASRGPA